MKKSNKKLIAISLSALMIAPLSFISKTSFAEETSSNSSVSESISESHESEVASSEESETPSEEKSSESSSEASELASSENTSSENTETSESTSPLAPSTKTYKDLDIETYNTLEDLPADRVTAIQTFLNDLSEKSSKSKIKMDIEAKNDNEKVDLSVEGNQTIADVANQVANLKFDAEGPQNSKVNGNVDIYLKDATTYIDFKTNQNVSSTVKLPLDRSQLTKDLMGSSSDLYSKATYKVKDHDSDGHDEIYALIGKDSIKDILKTSFEASAKQEDSNDAIKQQLATMEKQIVDSLDEIEKFSNVKGLVLPIELKVNNADNSVKEIKMDLKAVMELAVDYAQAKVAQTNSSQHVNNLVIDDFKIEVDDIEILATAPEISVPDSIVKNAKDLNEFIASMISAGSTSTDSSSTLETTSAQESNSESSSELESSSMSETNERSSN